MPRRYNQFCALARALDVVGERWTLLIVRELLLGPRRFNELARALPGIGRNLLAARMRELREAGLVERRAPGYDLTPRGRALEETLFALTRWEMEEMRLPEPGDELRAGPMPPRPRCGRRRPGLRCGCRRSSRCQRGDRGSPARRSEGG